MPSPKRSSRQDVDGLPRAYKGIHGNTLGACTRLGLADDPRTHRLAEAILSWPWPASMPRQATCRWFEASAAHFQDPRSGAIRTRAFPVYPLIRVSG